MGKVIEFKYPDSTIEKVCLITCKDSFIFSLPFEITGRGIKPFMIQDEHKYNGWFSYSATIKAFEKLRNQYPLLQQAYESNGYRKYNDNLGDWCKEIDDY